MSNRTISKIVAAVLLGAFAFLTSCTTESHGQPYQLPQSPKQEIHANT
jgi:hypothetical protein